jgi:hypothetical protein
MAYLISLSAGTSADVFPAKRSGDKTAPCTIVWSKRGTEIGAHSATYEVETSIIVRTLAPVDAGVSNAQQPRLDSESRVAATFDAFNRNVDSEGDKLAEDITTAARALAVSDPANHADLADYTAQAVKITGVESGFEDSTEAWNDTLNIIVLCCPSNVS